MTRYLIGLVLACLPAVASADDYASNYGDGMRLYAEGRYDIALKNLYRAYAEKPSANLMKLIIRSHDFMGHCSAVERQTLYFKDVYPKQELPTVQRCANPGTLKIQCSAPGQVLIDDMITAACGAEVKLPEGIHRLDGQQLDDVSEYAITPGETTVASLELNQERLTRNYHIPRLKDPRRYTVIKSQDGLYEIWVRSDLRDAADKNGLRVPGFTILRSTDGLYDISSDALREPYPSVKARDEREKRNIPVVPLNP